MALTRMTLEQIKARTPRIDRAAVEATTAGEIRRRMTEDGQDPDEDLHDEDVISLGFIRHRLGLPQTGFARAPRIPVAILRNGGQHRVAMDPATIAPMTIRAREPEAALRALRGRAA